jgi:hypothetical protein
MTPIDVVGDSGGFLGAIASAVGTLETAVGALAALVEVLIVGVCIVIAVEVARGVMRR